MSGTGKTYWSEKLAACAFQHISCDGLIEDKLRSELIGRGYRGIHGVAEWMGWPDADTFQVREAKYLACEQEVMREVIQRLKHDPEPNLVIDTTGSVIYSGDENCRALPELSTVVYLEASPTERTRLIQRYLESPKPVVWGQHFSKRENETLEAAIVRCYPQVLAYREGLYARYAHLTVPISLLGQSTLDGNGFLELVKRLGLQRR